MFYFFKTQKGFSLVQGIILAAVVSGSGLIINKLITSQKLLQKGTETRDQIDVLHENIYGVMQFRKNCEATIIANNVQDNLVAGVNPTLNQINSTSGPVYLKYDPGLSASENLANRTYMNGNVHITEMKINFNPAASEGTGTLDITYERLNSQDESKRTKKGYGAKVIKKSIGLNIQRDPFDPGKRFSSCYATTSAKDNTSAETGNKYLTKEMCLEMNNNNMGDGLITGVAMFVWDDKTSTCIPNAKCPDNMIYTGISSTGEVYCRLSNEWVDYNQMIDPNSSTDCPVGSQVSFVVEGNKVRISCQTPLP